MKILINFLSKLGFWPFVFIFTFVTIVGAELLVILQSYFLTGSFFSKNLIIAGFITPVVLGLPIFSIISYLIQHHKFLQDDQERLLLDLEEQSELLRSVIDENPDPVIVKNWDGKFVLANSACAKLYNTSPQDMIGKDDGDFIPDKEQAEFFKKNVQEIMLSEETRIVYEDSFDAKTGKRKHYKSIKRPYKNSRNESHILVIAHDLTKEKNTEEELRFMNDALDIASDASFLVNDEGKFLRVNQAASRDLGYTKEELLSMSVSDINPGINKKSWLEEFKRVKETKSSIVEVEHRRKDGSFYHAEVNSNYMHYHGKDYELAFVRDITQKKEQQEKLEYMAHFDALTDLPNREVLIDRINQAKAQVSRRKGSIAVLYIDLDGFKEVNDTYGHDIGDKLLKSLSATMKKLLREGDTIARFGGDEFVALLVDLNDREIINVFLERLLESISSMIEIDTHKLSVSASIGVTFYPQNHEVSSETLIRQADQAMYKAKETGKNKYIIFDEKKD